LEGTLKIIWFQPPCHEQGHLPLDQVAQSPIQPGLLEGAVTSVLQNYVPSEALYTGTAAIYCVSTARRTLKDEAGV